MAKLIALLFLLSCIFIVSPTTHATKKTSSWIQKICSETQATIHFYVQAISVGLNPTEYEVALATITSNSTTGFGLVRAVDDLLTAEPAYDSETVGRSQGLITNADLETLVLALKANIYFTSGKYKGSTISILGRNQVGNRKQEQPVVGGTGVFRGARGYAIASTYSYDVETSNGVFEVTLYVTYFDYSKRASTSNLLSGHGYVFN